MDDNINESNRIETDEDIIEEYYGSPYFFFQFDLIKEIIGVIKRHFKKILIMSFIFVVFVSVYLVFLNFNTCSLNITFRFESIEDGLNPDGTRFNIYEILSDDVLSTVVEELNNDKITVDYLRARLIVVDNVSTVSQAKIENSIKGGYENYTYLPTQYTVSYSQTFGPFRAGKILSTLSDAYSDYFVKNHVRNTTVLEPDFSDIKDTDYINSVVKIGNVLDSVIDYLNARNGEDQSFVSENSGKSYGDLLGILDKLKFVDLSRYESYINKSAITKDKETLVRQLTYSNKMIYDSKQLDEEKYDIYRYAIEKYDQSVTKVVFIPTYDSSKEYYMSRTNIGIDYLTENANEAARSIDGALGMISRNDYLLNIFGRTVPVAIDEATGLEIVADNAASLAKADEMRNSLISRINEVCSAAIVTEREYVEENERSLPTFKLTLFGLGLVSNIKYLIEGAAIGLLFSFIIAMFYQRIFKLIVLLFRTVFRR